MNFLVLYIQIFGFLGQKPEIFVPNLANAAAPPKTALQPKVDLGDFGLEAVSTSETHGKFTLKAGLVPSGYMENHHF